MTSPASSSPYPRLRVPSPPRLESAFRHRCANFFLSSMFYLSRNAPRFVRNFRPIGTSGSYACSRHFRRETDLNARRILGPDAPAAARRAYGRAVVASFYDFIFDIGRTAGLSRDELRSQILAIEGADAYRAVRADARGAIIATAHMGSFELGMTAMLDIEPDIHVVFQRDPNSRFERLRSEFRARMGIKEAAVNDGYAMWMQLREALSANAVVAMQADRAMPGQIGVKVPFLTGHALFPEGPAKLAAITGAPIIPVFAIRQPDGRVRIHIETPIRVDEPSEVAIGAAIAKLADVVGQYVRRHPEQWLVVNRAWCEDLPASENANA